MYTCKKCRWWGVDYAGTCDKVGHCITERGTKQFTLELDANDDTGLSGWLKTGPDFGCIHFTKRS